MVARLGCSGVRGRLAELPSPLSRLGRFLGPIMRAHAHYCIEQEIVMGWERAVLLYSISWS